MKISIRKEIAEDHHKVFHIIERAFKNEKFSDHKEQFLVERMRKSQAFIPELALVAEVDGKLVGYILMSKIKIKNEMEEFDSLALAPVCVLPQYQGKGIGGQLIKAAHGIAKKLGHVSIMLLGHENYYPGFGYKKAKKYDIQFPFEAPDENCMAIELVAQGLENVNGMVVYPEEFY